MKKSEDSSRNEYSFVRLYSKYFFRIIYCVITKDLSHLGRNYLETGSFTEIYFPEHNTIHSRNGRR